MGELDTGAALEGDQAKAWGQHQWVGGCDWTGSLASLSQPCYGWVMQCLRCPVELRCLGVLGGVLAFLPLFLVVEAGPASSCGCGCLPCSVWVSDSGDGSEGKRGWQRSLTAPHPLSFCTPSWHRRPSTRDISRVTGHHNTQMGVS